MTIETRIAALPWPEITGELHQRGFAKTPPILSADECAELAGLYDEDRRFRSRIVMERHGFGKGEYKYFTDPLPVLVKELRTTLYPPLAVVANDWAAKLGIEGFPDEHEPLLERCHAAGQTKPTPLLLRYEQEGYNCLHQDLYGSIYFPLQVAFVLSRRGLDFTGGDFLVTEQRPRAQSKGEAISLDQGEAVIFMTQYRPVAGTRGTYRVNMRHGVSRLLSGRRFTLGIIFHDAA